MKLLYLLALVTCAALCVGLGGCATITPADSTVTAAATASVPTGTESATPEQSVVFQNIVSEEKASMYAEGAWLVLDGIDTAQTMRIAREPNRFQENDPIAAALYGGKHPNQYRVLGINVALAFAHTLVTSWLDDEVSQREISDPHGTLGAWYCARVAWHVVSILGSGSAVIHNYSIGVTP
jgi:hypothetical protein